MTFIGSPPISVRSHVRVSATIVYRFNYRALTVLGGLRCRCNLDVDPRFRARHQEQGGQGQARGTTVAPNGNSPFCWLTSLSVADLGRGSAGKALKIFWEGLLLSTKRPLWLAVSDSGKRTFAS